MKKIFVYALPVVVSLAAIGISLNSHATAVQPIKQQQAPTSIVKVDDLDLVGEVGDVLVDGRKPGEASYSQAWKDLGDLATKPAL